ncbi:Integral membrane protein (fragment) [Streptantibioticus cattleyicolor NRRL 8057 = DSM 46488]
MPPPGPVGEPEYFGAPAGYGRDPRYDDAAGHTRTFAVDEAPGYPPAGYGDAHGPGYDDGQVATYRAGQTSAPPAGPRLRWRELLAGIVLRPGRTFWQMRDHQMWGPALIVTFVYGMLAVFGFDSARKDVLDSAFSNSIPWVVITAVAVVMSALMTGAVTHALARQFGGDGGWAPTIGLAMLITSLTDAPRLVFAVFLGGANGFVQVLGWLTWLACGALLTSMVSRSHDLPWPKALGAASVQLVALLVLFKLPVL